MLRPDWIDYPESIPDPLGHGERAVRFLRMLKHPKNPAPGRPFQLDPFQEAIVRRIYGPRNPDGTRIVRRVVLLLPRGNRKTSLAAGVTLLHLIGPERMPGQLIVSAASAHEQALELFGEAALIIRHDQRLAKRLEVREYVSRIAHKETGSRYVAVAADGNALHGKTPNVVIMDELHAWAGRAGQLQYDALDSALVKVPGTLSIIATTSGRGQENLGWKAVEYAIRVQKGQIEDPATLPVIFMAEPEDDWQDEDLWRAVNPGMAHGYPDLQAFRDKARKAEFSPFERDSFLQYNLNRWLDASTSPFVEMDANRHRTRFANYIPAVMSQVFEQAIDDGLMLSNPAKGIRRLKVPVERRKAHVPWPDWAVEKFRAEARPEPRLIFELGIGSVQRPADWCLFRWGDYDGDALRVTQGKTDITLVLPCTAELRAVLDAARPPDAKPADPILRGYRGGAMGYRSMADLMLDERKRLDLTAYDLHALRYRGVMELAWAGCTDEEIAAYSGHTTMAMIRKYAGEARQIMRARQARQKRP